MPAAWTSVGRVHRSGRWIRKVGLVAMSLATLQVAPADALPETSSPTLSLVRTIRTNPFTGTTQQLKDGEGTAFVPNNLSRPNVGGTDSLWLVDDGGDSVWEINPHSGVLKSRIAPADWANTPRFGCAPGSCLAPTNRFADLESMAYDAATDTLYVFSGPCCTSSVLPTAFRLKRRGDGSFYPESYQPLPSGSDNTAAGWNPGDGQVYVGKGSSIGTYNFVTNTFGSSMSLSGAGVSGVLGMTFSNGDLFVVTSKERLFRVDWPSRTLVSGWSFDLTPFNILDSRGVEVIADPTGKEQIHVFDGYSRASGDPLDSAVFVLDVCCGPSGPSASFTWAQTSGTTVQFTDTSTGGPTSWSWNFGDGGTSTQRSPSHTYASPGTYTVRLTASSGAGSSVSTQAVTIPNAPTASFSWAQTAGTTTVQFTDTSTGGPTSWSWNFGDGGTSTQRSPSHTYASPGNYQVTLTASNATGPNQATNTVTVTELPPPPAPSASFTWAQTSGTTVQFTDTSTGGPTTWSWDFGDGTTSTQRSPSHTYPSPGTYMASLTVSNAGGESNATDMVTVQAAPPPPAVSTFTPTADSYVEQTEPSRNFGTKVNLAGKLRTGNEKRPYLTFNVSGLQGGTITGVTLRLFVNDASPYGGDWYAVSPTWTETGITWNNAPPISGSKLGSIPAAPLGTWVEADLTGAVTQEGTYSFAMKTTTSDSVYYSSKEGTNRPQLVVEAGQPPGPDTTPPTVTSVSPANGTTDVPTSTKVDITFSEAMDRATAEGAFSLDDPAHPPVAGTFSWSGNTMKFAPAAPLADGTTYTAVVGTGARDAAGNALQSQMSWSFTTAVLAPPPPTGDPVIAAAGDIACASSTPGSNSCHQKATSDLLVGAGLDAVLPLGDLQYENGELANFNAYYDPTWGRVNDISYPVPGNHEYNTPGASGYFTYFQNKAFAASPGYYSFDVGTWHLIALNSNCSNVGGCGVGSPQEQWLRADLAAHPASCTLAYWHHPRFSSKGGSSSTQPFWQALYDSDAEVVLVGHHHFYERFAPQTPSGSADPTQGIRQFTVGSGGINFSTFGTAAANSEAHNDNTFGVLKLTLHPTSYDWEFVPEAGGSFADAGTTNCH